MFAKQNQPRYNDTMLTNEKTYHRIVFTNHKTMFHSTDWLYKE